MSIAAATVPPAPSKRPQHAAGAPIRPARARPSFHLLAAALCGVAAVAAIKLARLWLAQAPILDFSL